MPASESLQCEICHDMTDELLPERDLFTESPLRVCTYCASANARARENPHLWEGADRASPEDRMRALSLLQKVRAEMQRRLDTGEIVSELRER